MSRSVEDMGNRSSMKDADIAPPTESAAPLSGGPGLVDPWPSTGLDPPPPRSTAPEMPARLGRYRVQARLGAGGMGIVYLAHDHELDRHVAIKVVKTTAAGGASARQELLLREARAMARVTHPNVVTIHDVGVLGDTVFVAMERINGPNLGEWLRLQSQPWPKILDLFTAAGRGLAAVHAAGLVHRDVKPSNILLGADGVAKLTDFGLVQPQQTAGATSEGMTSDADERGLTRVGPRGGTRGYMSPEQLRGEPVDARTDIFSFCVGLHAALYGELPFSGATDDELVAQIETGERRSRPAHTAVPPQIDAIIERGLRSAPEERWPTMDALLVALERGRRRRRPGLGALVGAAALVAGALAATLRTAEPPCAGRDELLGGLWDGERRAAIEEGLRRASAGLGAQGASMVTAALDRYATSYADIREETCAASRRGELTPWRREQIDACLDERRAALTTLVGYLDEAGEALAPEAATLVERLPAIALCSSTAGSNDFTEPVGDLQLAAEVRALRAELAALAVEITAGQFDAARASVARLRGRITAAASPALSARVDALEGLLQSDMGNSARGVELLGASLQTSIRHGLDQQAVETALLLMKERVHDLGAFYAYDELARGMLARAGLEGSEFDVQRRSLRAGVEPPRSAWEHLHELVEEVRERPALPSWIRLRIYQQAISLGPQVGAVEAANELSREALELARGLRGENHPLVRAFLVASVHARIPTGDFDGALALAEEAVQAARDANASLADVLWTRALVREIRDELDEALADIQGATVSCEGPPRCGAMRRIRIATCLAVILDKRGRHDEARAALEGALRQGLDGAPPDYGLSARNTLADIELNAGRLAVARATFEEVHRRLAASGDEEDPRALYAIKGLARVDLAAGDRQTARTRLEAHLDRWERLDGESWELASALFTLAGALDDDANAEDRRLARAHAERAAAIYREIGAGFAVELAEVEAFLARP